MFNIKMINKCLYSVLIFSLILTTACSAYNVQTSETINIDDTHDVKYNNEITAYKNNLSDYIQQTIDGFSENYPYDIDTSVLVMDIENNELLGSYGDIDKYIVTDNIFKPISAAILINEYNISLDTEFENIPYTLENGNSIRSYDDESIYNNNYTFLEGFSDYNNSIYFHALKGHDLTAFYNTLSKLNLSKLDVKYDNGPNEVSTEILGNNLDASPKEIALIYSAFVNGGKLFGDIGSSNYTQVFTEKTGLQTLMLLNSVLEKSNDRYNLLKNVNNLKYNVSGMFSLQSITEDYKKHTAWFAGVYPAENPQLAVVLNISYATEDVGEDFDNRVMTEDLAPMVYDIINYSLDNYIKEGDYLTHIKNLNFFEKDNLENSIKYIYFGRSTCSKCVFVEPAIQQIIKENNDNLEIFYFNTDYWRGTDNIEDIYNKYNIELVPHIIKLDNEKISNSISFDNFNDLDVIRAELQNFTS